MWGFGDAVFCICMVSNNCYLFFVPGLDSLHNLTSMTKMNLRVDLRDGDESVFAKYSTFEVAKRNYKLSVGGYSGTAGEKKKTGSDMCCWGMWSSVPVMPF